MEQSRNNSDFYVYLVSYQNDKTMLEYICTDTSISEF